MLRFRVMRAVNALNVSPTLAQPLRGERAHRPSCSPGGPEPQPCAKTNFFRRVFPSEKLRQRPTTGTRGVVTDRDRIAVCISDAGESRVAVGSCPRTPRGGKSVEQTAASKRPPETASKPVVVCVNATSTASFTIHTTAAIRRRGMPPPHAGKRVSGATRLTTEASWRGRKPKSQLNLNKFRPAQCVKGDRGFLEVAVEP